jgi:hypothetical protein
MVVTRQHRCGPGNHRHFGVGISDHLMKTFIVAIQLALAILPVQATLAQVDTTLYRSWSVGVVAGEQGYDSNLGLEATTRGLFNGRICLRLRGNIVWMEAYKAFYDRWTTYHVMELSTVYQFPYIERVRPYMELGVIEVLPSETFSSLRRVDGLAFRAGIEMFVVTRPGFHVAYYFAGAVNRIEAYAEKMDNNPRYAEGIGFNMGFRFYVKGAR